MKRRFCFAALSLLLALNFATVQAAPDNQKATNCSQKTQVAGNPSVSSAQLTSADPFQTAFDYLVTFYPRWFTWEQGSGGPCNRLVGPNRISPLYQVVVAINNDTLYASTIVGAADEPVIVTLPNTEDSYSVLQLDQFGALEKNGMSGTVGPGVYAIVGPDWVGTLPSNATAFHVQDNYSELLLRADKFSKQGNTYVNMTAQAEAFRRNVKAQGLSEYLKNPTQGATDILPERNFATPLKTLADGLVARDPIVFLHMMQEAVASPSTNPLSANEQTLSDTFDALFADPTKLALLAAGAQAGHTALVENYHSHAISGSTWITFMDIANWDLSSFQGFLNRASITEFIQYGNNHNAAAYFHTFLDVNRQPLDGSQHSYSLRFAKDQIPEAKRFWSATVYTPESIELVPNKAKKYEVASYTPGLVTARDGSVTILMSVSRPRDFPEANWLPIPSGPFNVMLRDYGPEGSVLSGTYVPPPVVAQ
jgi:hypothetical protein